MTDDERENWLAGRRMGVGSSDAPILCGVGWRTAAQLYREKVGEVVDVPATGPLKRGLALEPLVAAEYEQAMGVELMPLPPAVHPARSWQRCSPDRRRADDGRLVELKTVAGFGDEWGEPGTDEVPDVYRVQCQHQMGVRGDRQMDLVALDVIAWVPRVYRLELSRDFWEWLTAEVERPFWFDHVLKHEPPSADWSDAFAGKVTRPPIPGTVALIDPECEAMIERQRELKDIAREAEYEASAIRQTLLSLMGDGERAEVGPYRLKRVFLKGGHVEYERQPSWRLDVRHSKQRKALTP